MENFERPELYEFHGVSMTHYFTDNWENIQNFKALPDDILIATYPKAGVYFYCVCFTTICVYHLFKCDMFLHMKKCKC